MVIADRRAGAGDHSGRGLFGVNMSVSFLGLFLLIGLFVGCLFLPTSARKIGIGLAVAIVVVLGMLVSLRTAREHSAVKVSQQAQSAQAKLRALQERVISRQYPGAQPGETNASAPVWSDAMEDEFDADVYPTKLGAARALGSRMVGSIRSIMPEPNESIQVVLFESPQYTGFNAEFKRGLERKAPGMRCSIEAARQLSPNEVRVTLRLLMGPPVGRLGGTSGQITGTASWDDKQTSQTVRFADAPWVDDFDRFARQRPREHYVVARSSEAATSEGEARQQAMQNARLQLEGLALSRWTGSSYVQFDVTPSIVQQGGFIADQFVQSFDGSAGKIWRHAILLDVSAPKLAWLTARTAPVAQVHADRMQRAPWIGQVGSAIGVLVLILVTYFFLSLATRGYYEWALRIAGLVLAVMVIVVFLYLA
jgi:protein-S-isoprenylcysteine O-methyltransferase Ste14